LDSRLVPPSQSGGGGGNDGGGGSGGGGSSGSGDGGAVDRTEIGPPELEEDKRPVPPHCAVSLAPRNM